MSVTINQTGGFIPQTKIKITDTRKDVILVNIRIDRKIGLGQYETIIQTDSDDNTYQYIDLNDFGKIYDYKVTYDIYQKKTITNSTTNKANYWKENFNLGDLKVNSSGELYGTGTATAKADYLKKLNTIGAHNINFTAYIGTGGNEKEKAKVKRNKKGEIIWKEKIDSRNNVKWDNIKIRFRFGITAYAYKYLFLTKAWSSTKFYARRLWFYINKQDVNSKRNQVKLVKATKSAIDLEIYFKRVKNTFTQGFSKNMNNLKSSSPLSSKGGKPTQLAIILKNGARISPDFSVKVTRPATTTWVKIGSGKKEQRITVKDEPDIDYGIIMNEYGDGFRFKRYEGNGLLITNDYEYSNSTQILEIQDSEYPIAYIKDNKKTPSIDFTVLVDNHAFKNRMRNKVLKGNSIYIFIPKKWQFQLENGYYAYESCLEQHIKEDNYYYNFRNARKVLGSVEEPPKMTYQRLKDEERNYNVVLDNFRDYEDLALSPTSNDILGRK